MILVHFHQRMQLPATGVEDLIGWIVYVGVEGKAWGTFAFLFGAGFAVLLARLEQRGQPAAPFYLRRLAVLAAVGLLTEVLFGFHILVEYAVWGVVLLMLRHASTRTLLLVALLAVTARPLAQAFAALTPEAAAGTATGAAGGLGAALEAVELAEQGRDYGALLVARLHLALVRYQPANAIRWFSGNNLALFVLGMLAIRHGIVAAPRRYLGTIAAAMLFGLLSWGAAWLLVGRVAEALPRGLGWPAASLFGLLQDQWLALTYVGAVVLVLAYRPAWQGRLAPAGHAGRMALTNYVAQAAVLDVLASGYGLELRLRPLLYPVAAALLFALEAGASRAWLARCRFGPLEWVWRSLTYGRRQPMRRPA